VTITTNTAFDTVAAAPVVGVIELIELDFVQGTLFLTTWPTNITIGAQVYTGLGSIGSVGEIRESEDGLSQSLSLTLSEVNSSLLALSLGGVSNYQGRGVRIRLALTDANMVISGTPVLRFSGFMDKVSVKRTGDNVGQITIECGIGGFDVRKNATGLRMNDSQHQASHPGELGFTYVQALISNPQLWLSKRFQSA